MATKYIPIYNVDTTVGRNGGNKPEDVMLVQYFLDAIAKGGNLPTKPPATGLSVDGKYSENLAEWIKWFQGACKAAGKTCVLDGSVTPASGIMQHGRNTIMHLNASFRRRFPKLHDCLEADPQLPGMLKAKFQEDSKKYQSQS